MIVQVASIIEFMDSTIHGYFSESMVKRYQKYMSKSPSFKRDFAFDAFKLSHKESVDTLLETLISMGDQPYYKAQTIIRHTPIEVQVCLFERFMSVRKNLSTYDSSKELETPDNLSEYIREILIGD